MKIRLTTLSENTAGKPGFSAEWGLSILVETDDHTILFDTGAGDVALRNADRLGIRIPSGTPIVLSHAHADHTGGLRTTLMLTGEVEIIAHPDVWADKYTKRRGGIERGIGVPFSREELEALGAHFNLVREPVHITENILITGEIPMVTGYEEIDNHLFDLVTAGVH